MSSSAQASSTSLHKHLQEVKRHVGLFRQLTGCLAVFCRATGDKLAVKVLPKQRGKLSREKTLAKIQHELVRHCQASCLMKHEHAAVPLMHRVACQGFPTIFVCK